ncbi:MAG: hypothetical protein ABGY08_12265 [Gammaproteobacteria bacterium]|jgi:hypothetical protein
MECKNALDLPENKTQKLLQELQIQQIELEMQNDNLLKSEENLVYEKK